MLLPVNPNFRKIPKLDGVKVMKNSYLQQIRDLVFQTRSFLIPMLVFAFGGGIVLTQIHRGDIVLWVNHWHNPAADFIFRYVTWLGDGLFWLILFIMIAARKRSFGLRAASTGLLSALAVQALKNIFKMERPIRVLIGHDLALVKGVDLYSFMSFPSGHTGAAFTGFYLLALWSGKSWVGFVCFLLACLVGFSRIYLVQHFFMDVYAGALIGTMMVIFVVALCRYRGWFGEAEK